MSSVLSAIEWSTGIEDAWASVASFVPKLLGFFLVLLIGYFIAKAIAKIADSVLERVGFDMAVERGGVKKALEKSKYDASDVVSKIVFYGLFLLVLQMAFGVFGQNPVSELITGIIAYLPKVLAAIVIIVVATAIATAARELISTALGGLSYGKMLGDAAGIAVVTVGVFAALNQLQIAPAIVNGLFYAILAVVAGSAIVAIGGGGIQPMQSRWQNALDKYDEEKPKIQQEMQGAKDRVAQRAEQVKGQAQAEMSKTQTQTQTGARRSPLKAQ